MGQVVPPRNIWHYLETFLALTTWRNATGIQRIGAGVAVQRPQRQRTALLHEESLYLQWRNAKWAPAQSIEAEKPWGGQGEKKYG